MGEHTPTPWNCASRYSSVVGVPIINQQGRRVGNTALPDMPTEWDHMKRQGEIDAAFICKAVNNHASLVGALKYALDELEYIKAKHGYVTTETAAIRAKASLDAVGASSND